MYVPAKNFIVAFVLHLSGMPSMAQLSINHAAGFNHEQKDTAIAGFVAPPVTAAPVAHPDRVKTVAAANIGLWSASFWALNKAWYADYEHSSFHFFNDIKEWNGMDKSGHVWTSYQISRVSYEMWRWTGKQKKQSLLLGGISGIAYQSIIEIQDGFSKKWGFSWPDMAANVSGAALFVVQEAAWQEQRIQLKIGYWPRNYAPDLAQRQDALFGKNDFGRILKDYNAQTYWASAGLHLFFPDFGLPRWLNISFGYGSDGLFGGTANKWTDKTGVHIDRSDIRRVRKFYLAPDVDLTKIKTNRKWVRSVFYVLNVLKFPAPALELDSKGRFRVHAVKF